MNRVVDINSDIPIDRIVDANVYDLGGTDQDFLLAWKAVQDASPYSLMWTPRNGGHWIVLRGAEIANIFEDHHKFSSRAVLVPKSWAEAYQVIPTTLDPPDHTPYRKRIHAALTPATVEAARPAIQKLAEQAVTEVLPLGHCDFIRDVATKLPLAVFLKIAELSHTNVSDLPGYNTPLTDAQGNRNGEDTMARFAEYLRPHCAKHLKTPKAGFLDRLIGESSNGAALPLEDAVDMATTMMTGGIDTVISSLGLIMAHLAKEDSLRHSLVQEPDLIPKAVRELLRRCPIMTKARLVTEECTIDGITLKPGEMVVLPPLHGLDERVFDDPLTVDIHRPAAPNLTFGAGVHRCPGSLLAIAEIEILLHCWLRYIPDFKIDPTRPMVSQAGVLGSVQSLDLIWPKQ